MAYHWDLLPQMVEHIEQAQGVAALAMLDDLLRELDRDSGHRPRLLALRVAQCMAACMRGARRGGAPSELLYREHLAALDRLSRLGTFVQIRNLLRRYVRRLVERVQPDRRSPMERAVRGMLEQMRMSLEHPRPLEHYAQVLELSVAHLSRSFTRIAGRPFRDELQRLRHEAARTLLMQSQDPIVDIARQVGQRSASRFIASFKRAHGVTPAEYRRRRPGGGERSRR